MEPASRPRVCRWNPKGGRRENLTHARQPRARQPSARSALILSWGAALALNTLAHSVLCCDFQAWLYAIQYVFNYP